MLEKGIEAWEPRDGEAGVWKGRPAVADGIRPFVVETDKTLPGQIRSTASISGFQQGPQGLRLVKPWE